MSVNTFSCSDLQNYFRRKLSKKKKWFFRNCQCHSIRYNCPRYTIFKQSINTAIRRVFVDRCNRLENYTNLEWFKKLNSSLLLEINQLYRTLNQFKTQWRFAMKLNQWGQEESAPLWLPEARCVWSDHKALTFFVQ